MNARTEAQWYIAVWNAYCHARVRLQIARQDLAVAVVEKDTPAEQVAREASKRWADRCLQLRKLAEGVLFQAERSGLA